MKSLMVIFCSLLAASAVFAETWTWTGRGTWLYNNSSNKDWRDGANWVDSQGVPGTQYPDNTYRPSDGDFLIFDSATYAHCFQAADGGSYGGIVFTNSFGGSYGPQVPIKDGGFVRYAVNKSVENQSYFCPGTFEFYVGKSVYVNSHFQGGTGTIRKTGAGELRLHVGTATFRTRSIELEEGILGVNVVDALTSLSQTLVFDGDGVTLDMKNKSQTMTAALVETPGIAGHQITASDNACLTLVGNQSDTTFSGKIAGKASVCWNPDDGTKTLTLAGGACDTTGTLIVSNGVLVLAEGTTFPQAKYAVEGGRIRFLAKTALASGSVTVDGQVVDDGIYTGSGALGRPVDWLDGETIVVIGVGGETGATVEATWMGTGDLSTVANWKDASELPPLGEGSVKMKVAGGNSATVDQTHWIRGVEIGSDVTAFGFTGSSPLWLGSLGLATPGVGGTYTMGASLGLTASQTWTVGAGDTLNLTVELQTLAPGTVTVVGGGTVNANVSQPDLANDFYFNGGTVRVNADGGLGTGETVVNLTNAVLDLQAERYDGAITLTGLGTTGEKALGPQTSKDYVFNGCFTRRVDGVSVSPASGKTWTFAGGLVLGPSTTHNFKGAGGTVVITNAPLKGGYSSRVNFRNGSRTHLYTVGNDINSAQQGWIVDQGTTLYTHVPYAVNGGHFNIAGNQGSLGTWDLCGCDQKVDSIQCGRGNNVTSGLTIGEYWKKSTQPGTIVSERPALLHDASTSYRINPSSQSSPSSTNWAYFVGQAGISKDGSYKGLWLNQTCMSSGTVQVTKGKLYFSKRYVDAQGNDYGTGSWPNAAKAVAKGTGTLVFEHAQAIGKETAVEISETGKVELPAGVNQRCGSLAIDGVAKPSGTYGSSASAAQVKDDAHFAGSGVLVVGKLGMYIIFR